MTEEVVAVVMTAVVLVAVAAAVAVVALAAVAAGGPLAALGGGGRCGCGSSPSCSRGTGSKGTKRAFPPCASACAAARASPSGTCVRRYSTAPPWAVSAEAARVGGTARSAAGHSWPSARESTHRQLLQHPTASSLKLPHPETQVHDTHREMPAGG